MKVEALKSFAGKISMNKSEIREIESGYTLSDLIDAGYVKCVDYEEKKTIKKVVSK